MWLTGKAGTERKFPFWRPRPRFCFSGNKIRGCPLWAHRSMAKRTGKEAQMLGTILLIILILLLIGALPNWGYSRGWGYGPSGGLGLVVLILLILVLMGRI